MIVMHNSNAPNTNAWTDHYLGLTMALSPVRILRHWILRRSFGDFITDRQARVADVGCGAGMFLSRLADEGFVNLSGLEPNATLRLSAMARDPRLAGRIVDGQAEALPFAEAGLDCLCCFNVLHHLEGVQAYRRAFGEFHRRLAPRGVFLFVEPCRKWIYAIKRSLAGVLSPASGSFANMRRFMLEEKDLMEGFIDQGGLFRDACVAEGYTVLRDMKFLHQWVFAARKP